jgi:hypothetical protein
VGLALALAPSARAQGDESRPFRLDGLMPAGVRDSATEGWTTFDFMLTNLTFKDRPARVLAFYEGQPGVQYGRDVWLPARTTVKTWVAVGPAPKQDAMGMRTLQFVLVDRLGGVNRPVLPRGEKRTRTQGVLYHERKNWSTAMLVDEELPEASNYGQLPQPPSRDVEAINVARTFRYIRKLSPYVHVMRGVPLPPSSLAFDGIDHFILASERLAQDPAGMRALRQWLQQGGKVWVMLDLVRPEVVAPLLGDGMDFQVVDRIGLTSAQIEGYPSSRERTEEGPVDFVRVLLPPGEPMRHAIKGWPTWFTRSVGRGKVVFTTLAARGWYQLRPGIPPVFQVLASTAGLLGSPAGPGPLLAATAIYPGRAADPGVPYASEPLEALAAELEPSRETNSFRSTAFKPGLAEEIGYSVAGRAMVGLIFGGFLLAALGLGLVLRRSRRPELLGWLGPAAALGAAGVFVALGESSRTAVPPTVAVGQVVEAGTGTDEVPVRGLFGMYRPTRGEAALGTEQAGRFDLDLAGLERIHQRVQTDMDRWHWENLELPVGVQFAPFQTTIATGRPVTAVAHFGPKGIEGTLAAGPFHGAADAILSVPGARKLAVRIGPDGTFRAGSTDLLPPGDYLAGDLNDRQQRRQEIYRQFLADGGPTRFRDRRLLFAWTEPVELPFSLVQGARRAGDALVIVPLRLERSPAGQSISIPAPFLAVRRIREQGPGPVVLGSNASADQHLRFQLPPEVLPFRVEKAQLTVKINAPSRQVTIGAWDQGQLRKLDSVSSPLDPIRQPIPDRTLLVLDDQGGLHLNLAVVDAEPARRGATGQKWTIEYLELEVSGRTEDDKGK